jgi:DNA-3-methyladenine glycosylase
VLLRAVEPLAGTPHMRRRRGVETDRLLTSGPGRLTAAFGITQAENGELMEASAVVVEAGEAVPHAQVLETRRIGITRAAELPLRFVIRGNQWLSR